MRLKAGISKYMLPKDMTPIHVILIIGKHEYPLQQIARAEDADKIKTPRGAYPYFWVFENPWDNKVAIIHILPKPIKAWKLTIHAQTWAKI